MAGCPDLRFFFIRHASTGVLCNTIHAYEVCPRTPLCQIHISALIRKEVITGKSTVFFLPSDFENLWRGTILNGCRDISSQSFTDVAITWPLCDRCASDVGRCGPTWPVTRPHRAEIRLNLGPKKFEPPFCALIPRDPDRPIRRSPQKRSSHSRPLV